MGAQTRKLTHAAEQQPAKQQSRVVRVDLTYLASDGRRYISSLS